MSADRWAGIAEVGSAWALRFGARGIKIRVAGRLNGADRLVDALATVG